MTTVESDAAARTAEAIRAQSHWYHTMELAPGVVTPGWFDLRPVVDRLPWPDVSGKRCLDVGPYDGFLSFELERRGAAEVVAADISSPAEWDWPVLLRERGPQTITARAGSEPGGGFRVAKELLESKVERREISVYELAPERVGTFDVVVCGSLMLHLRDPVRALEAIRSVCGERFLSAETIDPTLTLISRAPRARLLGGTRGQWWIPSRSAHRRMLEAAGFTVERASSPYLIPLGPGHPNRNSGRRPLRERLTTRLVAGAGNGVPHAALLARPA